MMNKLEKNPLNKVFSTAAILALALSACSAGDSDSNETIPQGNNIGASSNHEISGAAASGKVSSVSGGTKYEANLVGNTIELDWPENEDTYRLLINGKENEDYEAGYQAVSNTDARLDEMVGVMHVSFIGKDEKPISAYEVFDGGFDEFDIDLASNPDQTWTWSNIHYSYSVATTDPNASDSVFYVEDEDGQITFDGDQWTAQLGDVTLNGSLSGYDVSGTAILDYRNDGGPLMQGDFSGLDGIAQSIIRDAFGTVGGFAGESEGKTDSFAGAWVGED